LPNCSTLAFIDLNPSGPRRQTQTSRRPGHSPMPFTKKWGFDLTSHVAANGGGSTSNFCADGTSTNASALTPLIGCPDADRTVTDRGHSPSS
jgi:hypothetical protein